MTRAPKIAAQLITRQKVPLLNCFDVTKYDDLTSEDQRNVSSSFTCAIQVNFSLFVVVKLNVPHF